LTPLDCISQTYPDYVEYRAEGPGGVQVVRVFTRTFNPRLMVYCDRGGERIPTSLFLDELIAFAQDALLKQR